MLIQKLEIVGEESGTMWKKIFSGSGKNSQERSYGGGDARRGAISRSNIEKQPKLYRKSSISAMLFIFLMASQSRFFSVGPGTLFAGIYFGLLGDPLWDVLLSKLLLAMFVSIAQMSEILDAEFEDFGAVRALILVLDSLFGCLLYTGGLLQPALLYNNDCSMHERWGLRSGCRENWVPGRLWLKGWVGWIVILQEGEVKWGESCWVLCQPHCHLFQLLKQQRILAFKTQPVDKNYPVIELVVPILALSTDPSAAPKGHTDTPVTICKDSQRLLRIITYPGQQNYTILRSLLIPMKVDYFSGGFWVLVEDRSENFPFDGSMFQEFLGQLAQIQLYRSTAPDEIEDVLGASGNQRVGLEHCIVMNYNV